MTDTNPGHSRWYIERFRAMAAEGADLVGEARLVDAMVARGARILDAGCGSGRHTAYLQAAGHDVLGVDADAELIAAARADHPEGRFAVADLSELDLADEPPFDAILAAGNVLVFLAPGTESLVLQRFAAHLAPDGFVVTGFHTDRELSVADFDRAIEISGLRIEHRFATWDLRAWQPDANFVVTVLRHT